MSWFFLAIGGHILNGIAFLIDKILLSTTFRESGTYAVMVGFVSGIALLAFPWVRHWPDAHLQPLVAGFGLFFVLGLWAFFEALKRSEATRVVPIVGSLIPFVTVIASRVFFGDLLTTRQLFGVGLLMSATWILTTGSQKQRVRLSTVLICVLAALLFAAATLCGKYVLEHSDVVGAFVVSRVYAVFLAGVLVALHPRIRAEVLTIVWSSKTETRGRRSLLARFGPPLGQILGAVGFVLIHLAIMRGNISIVNALQAVQYALLVGVALALRSAAPRLLGETLTGNTLWLKTGALVVTAAGLYFVA